MPHALFSPHFRHLFTQWMITERDVTEKSAREYWYQLIDVTRVSERGWGEHTVRQSKPSYVTSTP